MVVPGGFLCSFDLSLIICKELTCTIISCINIILSSFSLQGEKLLVVCWWQFLWIFMFLVNTERSQTSNLLQVITPNGKICWPLTEVGTLQLPFCDITVLLKNRVPRTKYCHFNFDPNIIIHCLQYYWPSGDHLMQTSKWSNWCNQYLKLMFIKRQ